MSDRWVAVAVWVTVLVAFYLAVAVVPLTLEEMCRLGGGDWNQAWSRCYP